MAVRTDLQVSLRGDEKARPRWRQSGIEVPRRIRVVAVIFKKIEALPSRRRDEEVSRRGWRRLPETDIVN